MQFPYRSNPVLAAGYDIAVVYMEEPVQFTCNQKRLYGILHLPDTVMNPSTIVIIITGGPQVRIGAHRLYVQLSRFLCEHNIATLRFDYEGMGDSEGDFVGFQYAEASIDTATNYLRQKFKGKSNFLFWSLCDGATAAVLYAARNLEDVNGLILCNPLVLTEQGLARSTIKHYYINRIFNKKFLSKLIRFEVDVKETFKSLWKYISDAYLRGEASPDMSSAVTWELPDVVFDSLGSFEKPVGIILSANDIVASNFQDEMQKSEIMKMACKTNHITSCIINGADHTFTDPSAKEELFAVTLQMIRELTASDSRKRSV
jgi:exosortase A-associated hydrolase 1